MQALKHNQLKKMYASPYIWRININTLAFGSYILIFDNNHKEWEKSEYENDSINYYVRAQSQLLCKNSKIYIRSFDTQK